jgi:hypothetical protein
MRMAMIVMPMAKMRMTVIVRMLVHPRIILPARSSKRSLLRAYYAV